LFKAPVGLGREWYEKAARRVGGCLPDYDRVGLWLDMIDFVVKSGRRNA